MCLATLSSFDFPVFFSFSRENFRPFEILFLQKINSPYSSLTHHLLITVEEQQKKVLKHTHTNKQETRYSRVSFFIVAVRIWEFITHKTFKLIKIIRKWLFVWAETHTKRRGGSSEKRTWGDTWWRWWCDRKQGLRREDFLSFFSPCAYRSSWFNRRRTWMEDSHK